MNAPAEVRVIKTAAETALATAYTEARTRLPGGDAIAAQRAAAFDIFAKEGLPHRRVEEWKYTDLRALMREAKPLASPPDAAAKARAKTAGQMLGDVETRRIVFVDGAFVQELTDTAALERGLTVGSFAAALAAGDPALTEKLGTLAPGSDVAVALNTALMGDGAVIRIGAGSTIERPLHLIFVASEKPAASFVRSLVVVEPGARVIILASVCCAPGLTMMRPWNTPWASSSSTDLNTSRLWQLRALWLTTSVVSACWRPLISVVPRMPATVSSPLKLRNS